ncbi:unnamed protein product [Brassica oleracea var. botrytis]
MRVSLTQVSVLLKIKTGYTYMNIRFLVMYSVSFS